MQDALVVKVSQPWRIAPDIHHLQLVTFCALNAPIGQSASEPSDAVPQLGEELANGLLQN